MDGKQVWQSTSGSSEGIPMRRPWHTEGYLKIAHAMIYLMLNYGTSEWGAIDVLIVLGKQIRAEVGQ